MLLPEGPESDEIFDQTQKPNKGPSIRTDEHHIGHGRGYKEIKKLQQRNGRNQNWGTQNRFACLPQLESVCLCFVPPGWWVCWLPKDLGKNFDLVGDACFFFLFCYCDVLFKKLMYILMFLTFVEDVVIGAERCFYYLNYYYLNYYLKFCCLF